MSNNKKTFSIHTLGCKVNSYESNIIIDSCLKKGYEKVDFGQESDICIVNTCAVTGESARKSMQFVRRAKRKNPDCILVVAGCYVQVGELDKLILADIIIGSKHKSNIADYIEEFQVTDKKIIAIEDLAKECEFEKMSTDYTENTRATIKIQDGCNNFCSYCIIPYARGRIRSKSIQEAYEEIYELVARGYKEIVLTGIHLDSYGNERGEFDLCDLLEKIDTIKGLERIRLGSLEPIFITDKNIKRLEKIENLCPHFHLSLQSGCDETLKRMNRRYTTNDFEIAVNKLRDTFVDVAITTDVIVGFCGETEEEFEKSLSFVDKIGFSKVHVFPFSERKGTRAYEMPNKIDKSIKNERVEQMTIIAKRGEEKFLNKMVGKNYSILIEKVSEKYCEGHTKNYIKVKAPNLNCKENTIRIIKIKEVNNGECIGDVIN